MSMAELNNQAVSLLLSEGSKAAALKILKEAIDSLRSAGPKEQRPQENQNELDNTQSVFSVDVQNLRETNNTWFQFLYQRALLVSEDECSTDLKAAVVLYNVAFLSHMRGVEECSSKKLTGAIRLYVLALDMVKRHCREYGSERALLVCLAIANNLGDLYWQQSHDLNEARKCFTLVREILEHMEAVETGPSTGTVDEDEYSLFLLNAMVRAAGEIVAAAAA